MSSDSSVKYVGIKLVIPGWHKIYDSIFKEFESEFELSSSSSTDRENCHVTLAYGEGTDVSLRDAYLRIVGNLPEIHEVCSSPTQFSTKLSFSVLRSDNSNVIVLDLRDSDLTPKLLSWRRDVVKFITPKFLDYFPHSTVIFLNRNLSEEEIYKRINKLPFPEEVKLIPIGLELSSEVEDRIFLWK